MTKFRPLKALAFATLTVVLASVAFNAQAQSDAPPPPPIREPLPPKVTDPGEQLEPQVVIRREEGRTVEEYVSNGRVYMVRITPAIGPSYYLLDTTGDGILDQQHDRFEPVKPVYWKLFEW
ncbi:MAG: DUF2782 domain-containing protein [Wenzhouxiangellaceae bacterium]|nr:DUF2782 domain-containing protein [Wenzhouxiangellaceae bacterium]